MYNELTPYEKALAHFGDKVALIAGLEINSKITPEDAYQQIKQMYKQLKKLRKIEKDQWGDDDHESE